MSESTTPQSTTARTTRHPRTQLRVALAGGLGSGKSALGAALAGLGAVRIDADQLARDVVEPGTPGLAAVVARFGPDVLSADGTLDRAALARIVFADEAARQELNGILHPLIAARSGELMNAVAADAIVVYEIPLLVENGRAEDFDAVVVVQAPLAQRLQRLQGRGIGEADALARISAQASDKERRAIADEVIGNDGSLEDLQQSAQDLWPELLVWQAAKADAG